MSLNILKDIILKAGLSISKTQEEQFACYGNLLDEKNKVMNLTAVHSGEDTEIRHFADSLSSILYVNPFRELVLNSSDNQPVYVADLGTGAGFPGIPLAIMLPQVRFVLMDSLNKRISFIDEVVCELELKNVETSCGRLEELGRDAAFREKFDAVVSRAVADLRVLCELSSPFLKVGGVLVSYKGEKAAQELESSENAFSELKLALEQSVEYTEMNSEKKRSIVVVKKIDFCPDRYPRRTGIPSKRPL